MAVISRHPVCLQEASLPSSTASRALGPLLPSVDLPEEVPPACLPAA